MKFIRPMLLIILLSFFPHHLKSDETKKLPSEHEYNFYSGLFDFSDDKQKAGLIGLQHQNDKLFRNSFLGKLSPITGGFMTENAAVYLYSGVQSEFDLGFMSITPSFAPGYYNQGSGKDLGHALEFKTEVQVSFDILNISEEISSLSSIYLKHLATSIKGTKLLTCLPPAKSFNIPF